MMLVICRSKVQMYFLAIGECQKKQARTLLQMVSLLLGTKLLLMVMAMYQLSDDQRI